MPQEKIIKDNAKKYKICVSGAAVAKHCYKNWLVVAKELGKEIAKREMILVTGATTGVPLAVAEAVKKNNGLVIGISPAASKKSHTAKYKLPTKYHDLIIYSGMGYAGRNLILTKAADGVIVLCGRIGTLNEFTIAFEDEKPIGVLEGTGGTADIIRKIVANSFRGPGKIVYDSDPVKLLGKLIKVIKKEEEKIKRI